MFDGLRCLATTKGEILLVRSTTASVAAAVVRLRELAVSRPTGGEFLDKTVSTRTSNSIRWTFIQLLSDN